jgi:uncharacterized membrane protein YhaH (DUF805 family)
MDFFQAVASGFSKYANSHGRAARSEYWYWTLFAALVDLVAVVADSFIFADIEWGPVQIVTGVLLFLPGLAVSIRRLHDINRSGYWVLIALTVVGILMLIYWACIKGTTGDNDFGPDPLASPGDGTAAVRGSSP